MAPATLPDSDWTQRHHPISFARMIALKPIGRDIFESTSSAYPPRVPPRTYGGHVFAQAAYAAAKTVPKGLFIHNCTGHYLLVGNTNTPFRYHVQRVRDGGVYYLRKVEVFQNVNSSSSTTNSTEVDSESTKVGSLCFVATVAFKRDESHKHGEGAKLSERRQDFAHQEAPHDHIDRTYACVLRGKRFEDYPLVPGADGIWSDQLSVETWRLRTASFPGLEMRKVDMNKYLDLVGVPRGAGVRDRDRFEAAARWKLLIFYRLLREQDMQQQQQQQHQASPNNIINNEEKAEKDMVLLEDEDDLNLHACAHLYACDRNSLYLAQRALGYGEVEVHVSSLAQTVIFHTPVAQLKMVDSQGRRKMFVQESWSSHSGDDRVAHNSRLWDYDTGTIIATTLQDGLLRVPVNSKAALDLEASELRQSKI
ncbi:hypothetical protein DV736_g4955, partial [Chaetothyriales sp. CBS 134916]